MEALKRDLKTIADFERLPEGTLVQLIDGELVMSPAPTSIHQLILAELVFHLTSFVKQNQRGTVLFSPIDVYFSDIEAYQPDIVYVAKSRRQVITEKGIRGAPDLVMEILSPSTGYHDLIHKKGVYESYGVKEYWIVDPGERQIQVLENVNGKFEIVSENRKAGRVESKLLSGFSVSVEGVFTIED
ncbi:MAG: Uma2 family endonuclease [Ignavibacteriae bacterium]|nr:Uma2 family endonuclease [Ignavibacteriota bacterium]